MNGVESMRRREAPSQQPGFDPISSRLGGRGAGFLV